MYGWSKYYLRHGVTMQSNNVQYKYTLITRLSKIGEMKAVLDLLKEFCNKQTQNPDLFVFHPMKSVARSKERSGV